MLRKVLIAMLCALAALLCGASVAAARSGCGVSAYAVGCDKTMDARFRSPAPSGWTAGDGTFSVPLPGGRTAWVFGDTFLAGGGMVNNSLVVDDGTSFTTYLGGGGTSFLPAPAPGAWYWPSASIVEGPAVRMFAARIDRTGSGAWDFAHTDCAIFSIEATTMHRGAPQAVPGCARVNWGAALLEAPDGYTYIYGVESDVPGVTGLHVARVPTGHLTDQPWSYLTTSRTWASDQSSLATLATGVSQQLSVLAVPGGGYALISQGVWLSRTIYGSVASSPSEGFTARRALYVTPDDEPNTFTYNATAHPQLADGRGVLVSYNRNSSVWADLADPDRYRPRFIRVPFAALAPDPATGLAAQPADEADPLPPAPAPAPAPASPAPTGPAGAIPPAAPALPAAPAAPRVVPSPRAPVPAAKPLRATRAAARALSTRRVRVCATLSPVRRGAKVRVRVRGAARTVRAAAGGRVCGVLGLTLRSSAPLRITFTAGTAVAASKVRPAGFAAAARAHRRAHAR